MGIADIIPGVSGGTIALITGIYERLVHAISGINSLLVKEFFSRNFRKAFKNIKKIDFALFIPLLLGIALAFLALSHLMSYLLLEWTAITYAFFFGLILASASFVYKHAGNHHSRNFFYLILGFIFAFWFIGLKALEANHSLPIIFFSGALAICAMILPGISGAFILVLLNQYEFMINAIKNLLFDRLGVFIVGAVIGILSFSKFLDYLLRKHKGTTMSFLTGLMLGSLRLPYDRVVASVDKMLFPIIAAVVGFAIVFVLEKRFNHK
ncbi:MAG: DUF368 domain-containing protein [DPANN group archaeon]|nr:DUF368 domain-containing protein [DPANN group archaeon]